MKPPSYTELLAREAIPLCTNLHSKYERIAAIRKVDPKADDKILGITQLQMILLVTIIKEEQCEAN